MMRPSAPIQPRAARQPWADTIDIALFCSYPSGQNVLGQPLVFSEVEQGARIEPTISLYWDEAQRLMDELWATGLRPSAAKAGDGHLAAVESEKDAWKSMAGKAFAALLDNQQILTGILAKGPQIISSGGPALHLPEIR